MTPAIIGPTLSHQQREMLFAHCCGPVPVILNNSHVSSVRKSLEYRKLIRPDDCMTSRPEHTVLTPLGSEVACIILGHYADALVRTQAFRDAHRRNAHASSMARAITEAVV